MKFSITNRDEARIVVLHGDVREGVEPALKDLRAALPGGPVTFDCGALGAFNSPGIKAWTTFMNDVKKTSVITFVRMPAIMLNLALLVRPFLGNGTVKSLVVPFSCLGCGKTSYTLHDTADVLNGLRAKECDFCKAKVDADIDVESVSGLLRESKSG